MRFDSLIRELETDVRWQLGAAPSTSVLSADWVTRLTTLLAWGDGEIAWRAGVAKVTPSLGVRRGRAAADEWYGDLEVWPGTDDRVIVRRVPLFDEMLYAVTVAAARSPEAIERFVAAANTLWRRWRREAQRAVGCYGRLIEMRPVAWDELLLAPAFLDDVRTTVESFATAGERYRKWGMPYRRGLLFHGPPGNGKTMLCRAIVTALGWPVVFVEGDDDAHGIARAFTTAQELAPSVLCFEDVDSLFSGDDGLSSFLNHLDGFEATEGVLVLATTNHPEKLDPALTARPSRFDRIYAIEDPDRELRARYLTRLFANAGLDAAAIAELAADSDGMSMAFLKELFLGAALHAAARGLDQPTLEDARRSLPTVTSHRRVAHKAFATTRPAGFSRANV